MVEKIDPDHYFNPRTIWTCQACDEDVEGEDKGREEHLLECVKIPLLDFSKPITDWGPAEMSEDLTEEEGWTLSYIDYDVAMWKKKINTKEEWLENILAFYVKIQDGELIDIRACETDYYKRQMTIKPLQEELWAEMVGL